MLGDALGVLNIASLAGVDKALECGIQAAEVIHDSLKEAGSNWLEGVDPSFSDDQLALYKEKLITLDGLISKESEKVIDPIVK